jgi:hypothetical protein
MSEKDTNPKDIIGTSKAPLSCVPIPVLIEMGLGMLEGASKYGRHNWRRAGIRNSVYFDAAIRHLFAWWEGEDNDPDSGLSHITKALCTLAVLRDAQMAGMVTDDRPPKTNALPGVEPFYAWPNCMAERIIERHADKNPKHYTIKD